MAYEIKRVPEDFVVEEIDPEKKVIELGWTPEFDHESRGQHLVCVLEKRDYDTHLAMKRIARALRISQERIGYAGTKDKKAVTTQRISIQGVKKEDVEKLSLQDLTLKPWHYSEKKIKLGDLWGNRFTIKVYSDSPPKTENPGKIPNFFGEQRFGSIRPITHLVGKKIVEGDFEGAVKTYLAEVFEGEASQAKEARKALQQAWDYKKALQEFPKKYKYERAMLNHLVKHPGDYVGALRALPKNLRIMFVYAYQSHLFNKFLEKVIERGLEYEEGPLYGYALKPRNYLEKEVLEEEGVSLENFRIKNMPELSSKGKRRPLWVKPVGFRILERGEGYYVLRFALPKGCYATVVVDYLFGGAGRGIRTPEGRSQLA